MKTAETGNGHTPASRGRFDAVVETNRPVCREHFALRLRVTGPRAFPATAPGQFVQLGCRTPEAAQDTEAMLGREIEWSPGQPPAARQPELCEPLALLRRPFSLAGRGDDGDGAWIEIIHRVVGVGTDWLARLKPGDAVDLIGPLGNSFTLPHDKAIGLLVGGGVGLPPMFYLAETLRHAGWDSVGFVGAMTRDLLAVTFDENVEPDPEGLPKLSALEFAHHNFPSVITTNDGSCGLKGLITDGLERMIEMLPEDRRSVTRIFTCGPDPMMHAVAVMAKRYGIDCEVCLEQAMACGMGTCQSCVVKIDPTLWHAERREPAHDMTADGRPWRFKLACTDGPVFNADAVVWQM